MSPRRTIILALLVLLAAGCTHTPPPRYYVLSGPALGADTATRGGPRIGLGPIKLPDYLDRPQIVTRSSANELQLASDRRWAEPLSASFARALHAHLLSALPSSDVVLHPWASSAGVARQVTLDVLRFDRDADGRFVLSARWAVGRPGALGEATPHTSEFSLPAGEAEDYGALVAAATDAVAALARDIAAALAAAP